MSFITALTGGLGGVSLGDAVVAVAVDTTPLKAGLAEARGEVSAGTSSMAASLKRLGPAFAAAGAAAVISFGVKSVEAFQEAEVGLQKLKVAFGDNTAALEADAKALQEWSGFSDEAIIAADTIYARLGLTADQMHELIPLTLDFARATGQDAAASAQSLAKALLGSSRALKAVGIASTDFVVTGDRAKDLANLMGLLQDRIGGTAKAVSGNLDVKLAVLDNQVNELQESIGKALVPSLIDLTDAASKLVTEAAPFIEGFFRALAVALQGAAEGLGTLVDDLQTAGDLIHFFGSQSDEAADHVGTFDKFLGALGVGVKALANPFGALKNGVDLTVGSVDEATSATTDYNQVAEESVAILKAQKAAEDALAGGLLSVVSALRTVADDQKTVNQLRKQGKLDTQEGRDAEITLLEAQLSLNSAVQDYKAEQKAAGANTKEAMDHLFDLGRQANLTKGDVRGLLGSVDGLSGALGTAKGQADGLGRSLDALNGRKVNVSIITHLIQTGKLD